MEKMVGKLSADKKQMRDLPCKSCGSSDALVLYLDKDEAYCFSCGKAWKNYQGDNVVEISNTAAFKPREIYTLADGPLPHRKLTEETLVKFGVKLKVNSNGEAVGIVSPFTDYDGKVIATKHKIYPQEEGGKNKYWCDGPIDDACLFGMDKFAGGRKYLTITEGEEDAMAAWQMLGKISNVVSLKNGAKSVKACFQDLQVYDWVNSFDQIVVCVDNDEKGREAKADLVEMFSPEKVRVMKLRHKDANVYLMKGLDKDFERDWWAAKPEIMEGIKNGADLEEWVFTPDEVESIDWPYEELNRMLLGIRMGEMTVLSAGSGAGKTLVMCELVHWLLEKTPHSIGCLFLENSEAKTSRDLVGVAMSYPLRFAMQNKHTYEQAVFEYDALKGRVGAFVQDRKDAFDRSLGSKRIWTIGDKDFGMNNIERVINRVRYMAKVLGCKYIFLDHISIIVSSQEAGDERKALDEIATKLRMLVHELNIHLFMVSHLRRPQGKSHEEGGKTSLSDLRGTAGIGQLADTVIGLERDGQNEDEQIRNTTLLRVLKSRFTGITGPSSYLFFDKNTYRLTEVKGTPQVENVDGKDGPVFDLSKFSGVEP
jgi:twinkle protein